MQISFSPLLLAALLCTTMSTSRAETANQDCRRLGLSVCPTPVDTALPDARTMLSWGQAERVIGFRNDWRMYDGDVFKAKNPSALPLGLKDLSSVDYEIDGKRYPLAAYLSRNNVTGLMVIKDGKVVYRYYGNGNTPDTLWTSRSVGKSVVSTLVGIALKQGTIHSLDDTAVTYDPSLKGTAWAGITIRQLLQHVSGVAWNEDYTNPASDFARLTRCEAGTDPYACVTALVASPERPSVATPGTTWSYSSGGAWVLGDVLEKATGKTIAQNLQEMIWQPYGMTHDGVWHSYRQNRHDVGAHGFNATMEDWGKFGLFVMNDGVLPDGRKTLPDSWLKACSQWTKARHSVSPAHPDGTYGFEWWHNSVPAAADTVAPKTGLSPSESLWAMGIFGQLLVVDPQEKLVIVQWATWPEAEPSFSRQPLEASLMFNAIANRLRN